MPLAAALPAVIGAGASIYGASQQSSAAKHAADAQAQASAAAIAEQRRQYDQTRTDHLPWLTAGTNALGQMGRLNSGDMSSFHESPDYQYGMDQLIKNDDRSASAHGRLYSGGYGQDFAKDVIGYANQGYNAYYNRLASLAGLGQTTATSLGQFGANSANQIGQQLDNAGYARASGIVASGNAWANAGNQIGNAFGNAFSQSGNTDTAASHQGDSPGGSVSVLPWYE